MSFGRLDDLRSSFHGGDSRGRARGLFRRGGPDGSSSSPAGSPMGSPIFGRRKLPQLQLQQLNSHDGLEDFSGCVSGPPSLASSRESSLDRAHWGRAAMAATAPDSSPGSRLYSIVERVRASPKLKLKQRLQVMRSGSFNDVSSASSEVAGASNTDKFRSVAMEAKRKKWLLGRSESLRAAPAVTGLGSDPSSPELEPRRGSLPPARSGSGALFTPTRERSLDRVGRMERKAALTHTRSLRLAPASATAAPASEDDASRVKGFVNRYSEFSSIDSQICFEDYEPNWTCKLLQLWRQYAHMDSVLRCPNKQRVYTLVCTNYGLRT